MHACWADSFVIITKTRLFKYIENFTSKNWKFSDKKHWFFFFIFLLNIYVFKQKKMYTPVNPSFTIYKNEV